MIATVTHCGEAVSNANTTTTGANDIVVSGTGPLLAWITCPVINLVSTAMNWNGHDFSPVAAQISADGTTDVCGRLWVCLNPTPGTGTLTATHGATGSFRRVSMVQLGNVPNDAGWWDSPGVIDTWVAADEYELSVSSETDDVPIIFLGIRNVASAPTFTPNAATTAVSGAGGLAGTTLRSFIGTGVGAATVVLGGTASGNSPAVVGIALNINSLPDPDPPGPGGSSIFSGRRRRWLAAEEAW